LAGVVLMAERDLVVFGDWGTSRLRLALFDDETRLAEVEGPGIGALVASPADTLLAALAPWRERHALKRVTLCGMAGSRTGLVDAPYTPCPAGVTDWAREAAAITLDGLQVEVAPGVAGTAPNSAPDVMRGEEAQVFGALALRPELAKGDQWFVLPGTHSKWCHVRDGRIVSFQTFLTGELFALLSTRSSLLLGADKVENPDHHAAGFAEGLERAREGRLLGSLFETRSAQLRAGRSGAWATGFLSGLAIGSEVVEATATFEARAVTLVGAEALTGRYIPALQEHSVSSQVLGGEDCVLAGLRLFASARP
jgi:2-dehydro-3-deoxygalactonokinase